MVLIDNVGSNTYKIMGASGSGTFTVQNDNSGSSKIITIKL
jgi:hypothetical protein